MFKMDKHNPYFRLQTYYGWFVNDKNNYWMDDSFECGISIKHLHEKLNIPVAVIRKDILCIFKWQRSIRDFLDEKKSLNKIEIDEKPEISFYDEDDSYQLLNDKYHIEKLIDEFYNQESDTFEKLFIEGTFDNLPIALLVEENMYRFPLSQEEAVALWNLNITKDVKLNRFEFDRTYIDFYDVKDSYLFTNQYMDINSKLEKINQAITEKNCLDIVYRVSADRTIKFYFKPLKITYDADEDVYAILSIYKGRVQVHRLDRIESICESDKKIADADESLLDIYPNVWGNCFSDEPEQVKVRFYNEANVWNKVKKELANRVNGKLYEKDGYLYYEDIVYGISKFRSWLYGYGSSAIVLEPESLRKHIIDSLREREKYYIEN